MIYANSNFHTVHVQGNPSDFITELTIIIKAVYENVKRGCGEEEANKVLAKIGRTATSDEINQFIIGM